MNESLRMRISQGECVSELTVDRCPVCVDRCEAFGNKISFNNLLDGTGVTNKEE